MRRGQILYFGRIIALAAFSIIGAVWALVRYYTHPHAQMVVAVPPPAPTYDADAGEIPVPEIYLQGEHTP